MARIIYGALAQDVRGSLAGTTFTKCRSGATIRQKTSPTQPRTAAQLRARAIFSRCSQTWRSLTDTQRADWANYANRHPVTDVFGRSITLTGNQEFTKINAIELGHGNPILTTPPSE